MYLVVGLGNPGRKYIGTRHNVGFDTIDLLAYRNSVKLNKLKFHGAFNDISINNEKTLIVKPLTYMNRSGITVLDMINYYKVPIENTILIYDDVDLEFCKLRIRPSGSAGTHNGMKSVIYQMQDDKFPRIRIGIGRNPDLELADYVLQKFSKEDREEINNTIMTAANAVEEIITNGVDSAMNKYN